MTKGTDVFVGFTSGVSDGIGTFKDTCVGVSSVNIGGLYVGDFANTVQLEGVQFERIASDK